jgi:hypothetical protein
MTINAGRAKLKSRRTGIECVVVAVIPLVIIVIIVIVIIVIIVIGYAMMICIG